MRIQIPLHLIDTNSENPRKTFQRIAELAETIFECGLIHNLVVKKVPPTAGQAEGRYEVKAGERRRMALLLLAKEERIPPDYPVPCYVIDGDGEIESIIENIQREPLPPWEDGASFDRLVDRRGMTHDQIAKAIGKSRAHVTHCIRISRGLSPKIIPILIRIGSAGPNFIEILKISQMVDRLTLGPDHDKQRAWLESFVSRGSGARRKKYKTRRYYNDRLRELERMEFSSEVDTVVQAVVRYLNGEVLSLPMLKKDVTEISH